MEPAEIKISFTDHKDNLKQLWKAEYHDTLVTGSIHYSININTVSSAQEIKQEEEDPEAPKEYTTPSKIEALKDFKQAVEILISRIQAAIEEAE